MGKEAKKMIIITVQGIPEMFGKKKLLKLCSQLCGTVQGELHIKYGVGLHEVSAFFPRDLIIEGLGEEIVVKVEDFTEKKISLELDLREKIKNSLCGVLFYSFPKAKSIRVKIDF